MTARTPEAVAALHEAANLCRCAGHKVRAAMESGADEPLSSHDAAAVAFWCAELISAIADAHDPIAEAREIVGRIGWTGDPGSEEGGYWEMSDPDYFALCRALGREVDE